MTHPASSAEAFLTHFHDARPGLTPNAFGAVPVVFRGAVHPSSYAVLADMLPATPVPQAVLDLACGDGHLLALLAARHGPALALAGVDLSAGELAAATRRLGTTATLAQARAQALPWPATHFDAVLCHLALMLMDDAPRVLAEVHRCLKPGGMFAAIVGASGPRAPALTHFIRAFERRTRDPRWADLRFGDAKVRTPEGITGLLQEAGFNELLIEDVQVPQRVTPAQLWPALLDMYDLHLLTEPDRDAVRQELMEAVAGECDTKGTLEFSRTLRVMRGVAGPDGGAAATPSVR